MALSLNNDDDDDDVVETILGDYDGVYELNQHVMYRLYFT